MLAHSSSPVVYYEDDMTENDGVNENVDHVIEVSSKVVQLLSQDGTDSPIKNGRDDDDRARTVVAEPVLNRVQAGV